jgi:hypothetical protein
MKQYENRVTITGEVDSSLEKAIGPSTQELQKFANPMKSISELMGEANAGANGLLPAPPLCEGGGLGRLCSLLLFSH